ncbi:MAG: hypothetical protein GKR89_15315 [Candidatus Latescibacteria bacterium]|nr:hypothetical protein [Candidatus Latescibacterota bacterium]
MTAESNSSAPRNGVTAVAVVVGAIGCLFIAAGEPFGVLVLRASPMAADYSTGAALFLFFVFSLVVNPLCKLLVGRSLEPGELATVYIMLAVAAAIPSWGLTMNLVPLLGGFFYYATPENEWAAFIQPHLPTWLVPDDPAAIQQLFEGGTKGAAIPWMVWGRPLLAWSGFVLTLYFTTLCLLVILRRQWVERERLLFPLSTLPLEMSQSDGGYLAPFFRNPLTWVGFAIPALVGSLSALHSYYNFIPYVDLSLWLPVLRRSVYLNCTPHFEVIGLSYLLSLDVSFGVWFFALLNVMAMGLLRMLGWSIGPEQPYSSPAPPSIAHIALGALFFLVFSGLWHSRQHLRAVWDKTVGQAADIDDSNELLPYRVALSGAVGGTIVGVFWLWVAGMNFLTALVFMVTALVIFVGLARVISQTGLAYCRATVAPAVFTVNALGSSVVGPAGLTTLALNFPWSADIRTFVMASAATGLKIAQVRGLNGRRLFAAIGLAIVVTLVGSVWAVVELGYRYGGINLTSWQFGQMTAYTGNWITHNIKNPEPVHLAHLAFTGVGALLMGALTYIKGRFIGFPIHPIGMTLGLAHPLQTVWFSVFLAWLVKMLILKYGGALLYKRLRPFFLGLVLGAFGTAGVWLVIDAIMGMSGNRLIRIG